MSAQGSARAKAYGIAVKGLELRRQMLVRGLTGAALARRAGVSAATVSQAVNDRRVHPDKLRAIVAVLATIEPIPGITQFAAEDDQGLLGTEQSPWSGDRTATTGELL
jgi:transcriptional regulator with XRE-family HTH domain